MNLRISRKTKIINKTDIIRLRQGIQILHQFLIFSGSLTIQNSLIFQIYILKSKI